MSARDYVARLWMTRTAFRRTFNGPSGKPHEDGRMALLELRKFCYASRPTLKISPVSGNVDPLAMAAAEGRREVYNRILSYLDLNDEDLVRMSQQAEMNDA